MRWIVGFIIAASLGVATYFIGLGLYLEQPVAIDQPRIFEVRRGLPLQKVAEALKQQGYIEGSARLFSSVGRFKGYGSQLKFGEYLIEPGFTYRDLLDKIVSGKNYRYPITFVEGDHMYRYAQQVEDMKLGKAAVFLAKAKNPQFVKKLLGEHQESLEGYLFPDTYHFTKSDGVETILKTMVKKFRSQYSQLSSGGQKFSRHEIVTLASLIEKETGAPEERPLISSVFHNRIKKKMRLQTDPTILYGMLDESGVEARNIRKSDIRKPTRYNTYVIKGLPPGPIANPGIESLRAALAPARSDFLFFVSRNDGTHVFTKNYQDHQRGVQRFQLDPKMRAGKSWRDLQKRKEAK